MKKRIYTFILVFSMLISVYTSMDTGINAKIADGVIEEEIIQTPEELALQKKFENEVEVADKRNSLARASNKIWITLSVPYVKQSTNYYCGPATTLQTQKYYYPKTGSTQNSLAKSLGTTKNGTAYSSIKKVLNSRSYIKNKYYFHNVTGYSNTAMANYIGNTISRGKPVVLNIAIFSKNTTSRKQIGYVTNGHFLNANGSYGSVSHYGMSSVTHLRFKDPFNSKGTMANKAGQVTVTAGVARTVINNQPSTTKYILI